MAKVIHSCICLTCGQRNDHSTEDGYCRNGHDDWLEYRDVVGKNKWFWRACRVFSLSPAELTDKFLDPEVKEIEVVW